MADFMEFCRIIVVVILIF